MDLYGQYAYQMKAENILNLNLTSEDMICYKNYAYDQFFDFCIKTNIWPCCLWNQPMENFAIYFTTAESFSLKPEKILKFPYYLRNIIQREI